MWDALILRVRFQRNDKRSEVLPLSPPNIHNTFIISKEEIQWLMVICGMLDP
jgi:hypothetical protein